MGVNYIYILYCVLTIWYFYWLFGFLKGLFLLKNTSEKFGFTVSIIVAAKNEEVNISKCLSGLVSQNYPQNLYEIIVVNDESTDKTAAIVTELAHKNNLIKLLNSNDLKTPLTGKKGLLRLE